MTMQELRAKINKEIEELNAKYETIPENDIVERANVLGKINGLLTASILSFGEI